MESFEVTVDLFKCLNGEFFIRFMRNAFLFPPYFGGNLDAIDECMRDLSWIQEREIRVKLINFEKASKTNEGAARNLVEMFRLYEIFWKGRGLNEDKKEFILKILQ